MEENSKLISKLEFINKLRKTPILLLIPFGIVLVVITLILAITQGDLSKLPFIPKENYQKAMENVVKKTFNSPKDKEIITNFEQAAAQTDYILAYNQYIKTYSLMNIAYKADSNPKYKEAMDKLRGYLIAFPQFSEEDLK